LPADSPYRLTNRTSFWAELLDVFRRAGSRRHAAVPVSAAPRKPR
jgi:hypothetical protein